MRQILIEKMKIEIENRLRTFLRDEGIELCIAANDNLGENEPAVLLEGLEDGPLSGTQLLSEIRVILGILGKPWRCDTLVNGLYHALHPHHITFCELKVILMSLHIETVHRIRPRKIRTRAVMRYIVEENR